MTDVPREALVVYDFDKIVEAKRADLINQIVALGLDHLIVNSANISIKRPRGELRELVERLPADFDYGFFSRDDLVNAVAERAQSIGRSQRWVDTNSTLWWNMVTSTAHDTLIKRRRNPDGLVLSLTDAVQVLQKTEPGQWNRLQGYEGWLEIGEGLVETLNHMAYKRLGESQAPSE